MKLVLDHNTSDDSKFLQRLKEIATPTLVIVHAPPTTFLHIADHLLQYSSIPAAVFFCSSTDPLGVGTNLLGPRTLPIRGRLFKDFNLLVDEKLRNGDLSKLLASLDESRLPLDFTELQDEAVPTFPEYLAAWLLCSQVERSDLAERFAAQAQREVDRFAKGKTLSVSLARELVANIATR